MEYISTVQEPQSEPPIDFDGEGLFDVERMANHARRLARSQSVGTRVRFTRPPQLLLRESFKGLSTVYQRIVQATRKEVPLPPAADWLLDNFYLIKEAARQLQEDLPWSYYLVLPKLEGGSHSGRPRVFSVVSHLADRTDNYFDEKNVWVFLSAFQEVTSLQMSELWALPAMMRLVLLQRLSALGAQVSESLYERDEAERWAKRVAERAAKDPSEVVFELAAMAEQYAPLPGSFVVGLANALRASGPATSIALDWLEKRLETRNVTLEEVIRRETQRQTQRQASIANAIMSLRRTIEFDWENLIESLALVDGVLRRDPMAVFGQMDFRTRDSYRHVVEDLARYSRATEVGVAERAILMAEAYAEGTTAIVGGDDNVAVGDKPLPLQAHVGYWLLNHGRRALESEIGYRPPLLWRPVRFGRRRPAVTYAGIVSMLIIFLMSGAWFVAASSGAEGWRFLLAMAVSALPALELGISLANWLVTRAFPPSRLPRLDNELPIPSDCGSFVVVPTLVSSPEDLFRQIEHLEVHALANPDRAFRFALLSDFSDAPEQTMPDDAAILAAAHSSIHALNQRWRLRGAKEGAEEGDTFFFLHRERLWNPQEGVWMGWERKRGKLEEFNALLRNPNAKTTYTTIEGDLRPAIEGNAIRYVVTLDADTRLPPGAAAELVRTAAHPLNRPQFDSQKGRVVRGFGILQPRVGISIASEQRTTFAQVFSGNVGVDPYTTAVSDVYQDLFGVGIFTGKGLYDVDAFHQALTGAIPENAVLSHDLLEGNYARAALQTDVVVFDDYPSSYAAGARRQHRWVRGDWQILPWLLPFVRTQSGRWCRNPVPLLGRWKMFDNLRRSLTQPALLVFLLLGWTILPGSFLLWTLLGVGVIAFPIYGPFAAAILGHPKDIKWKSYLRSTLGDARRSTLLVGLSVAFLAHQAYLMTDAIVRTLWRMLVSRKHLLEWTTAHKAEQAGGDAPGIWFSPIWGVLVLAIVGLMDPMATFLAVPFSALWIVAPWVARASSKALRDDTFQITDADRPYLRAIARRTWRYFDDFITAEDGYLPPDNYQEQPFNGLARRTSPTNIGMGLLAVQSAADFGYATVSQTVERLGHMFDGLEKLERNRGHFYNWYETSSLQPLPPRYISTVDSGNLVASLLTLKQALQDIPDSRWPNPSLFEGLSDSLACFDEGLVTAPDRDEAAAFGVAADAVRRALPDATPKSTSEFATALLRMEGPARALAGLVPTEKAEKASAPREIDYWAAQPLFQISGALQEIRALAPWSFSEEISEELDACRTLGQILAKSKRLNGGSAALGGVAVSELVARIGNLESRCETMAVEHDFTPLYDSRRRLFLIGFNADSGQPDASTYDLLASECRVASLIAIGKGQAPPEHWFRLGRPTTLADGYRALLSWSGTMFEYLMPVLFTRLYDDTLLAETARGAIGFQKAYGDQKNLPWGVSESAYATLDIHLTYQYRAFGVPGLGLKRGLAEDYVVSPYSSFLSMMVRPGRSLRNLKAMRDDCRAYGPYGYYESLDFTRERLVSDEEFEVVRTYMAHHQGMSLLALVNVLKNDLVQRRFHNDPLVRSVELLLQERVPTELELLSPHPDELEAIEPVEVATSRSSVIHIPGEALHAPTPAGMMLSNGEHTTVITAAGAGFAHVGDTALTRWAPDRTSEDQGVFLYVRDLESERTWSAGRQPIANDEPDRYEAWFHLNKVEIARVDDWIETFTEIIVSPEDNVELRRYTLTNYGDTPRTLDVTSYAEVVLTTPEADATHPAFAKLFVRTEVDRDRRTLLASRRARHADEGHPWLFHTLCGHDDDAVDIEYESDRMQFIGRNRSLAQPQALDSGAHLSGTMGPVLDPIVSIRCGVTLKPRERVTVTFALGTTASRAEALRIADRYARPEAVNRAFELAHVYGLVELPHCALTSDRALYFQQIATALRYDAPSIRAPESVLRRNRRPQSGLWAYGISGDLPIVVVRVRNVDELELVRLLLQAHAYWRLKGFKVDLVILNEHPPSYADEVQESVQQAVEASTSRGLMDQNGGVFLRKVAGMPEDELALMLTVAGLVIDGELPDLSVPLDKESEKPELPYLRTALAREEKPSVRSRLMPFAQPADGESRHLSRRPQRDDEVANGFTPDELLFFNGYGGFAPDGREYVIHIGGEKGPACTPLPWTNVIANETFGFLATEAGSGMTWQGNSQMNKLTPWSNDPVTDPADEALWLLDEEDGEFWSSTPQPSPGPAGYEINHGWGYSGFRTTSYGIEAKTLMFAPSTDPVKVIRLSLTNLSGRARKLSVFRYQALAMSDRRTNGMRFVTVQPDLGTGSLFAWNRYNSIYSDRVVFADAARLHVQNPIEGVSFTADRTEFLGRLGSVASPAALRKDSELGSEAAAGQDPCAAFRVPVTLEPGESAEFVFLLGQASSREDARTLVRTYRGHNAVETALGDVTTKWQQTLGALQIQTPVQGLDLLVNGWLLYQNLGCRLWGRSGFYQSGGAFGFRDQIQDSLALLFTRPELTRRQILIHAAQQFVEGDVLHWWHPEVGAGIRTRFSDDLLWLPYAVATYVRTTGDAEFLNEEVYFLSARSLEAGEDEAYLSPGVADETGTVFEHACRAIDLSLTRGAHGLPLMGSGDWNDGMNRVGNEGAGESVWLGFFLFDILDAIIPLAEVRDETARVEQYTTYQNKLQSALNNAGWDGAWFRRAFYDDGTPLGSSQNMECRIDAIAQGWSVISGAGEPEKAAQALDSALEQLVDEEAGIIRLLTPPFDQTEHDPGYIKGYLPGVRENGGQYTHGILWLIRAVAERGQTSRAMQLLEMILPTTRTKTRSGADRYKTEPFAVAADVYGANPHTGRGGWTWYTGAAGWMYRVAVETILGFGIENGDTLVLQPRVPAEWPECTIRYRHGEAIYQIDILNPDAVEGKLASATVNEDALVVENGVARIPLASDGKENRIRLIIGDSDNIRGDSTATQPATQGENPRH